VSRGLGVALFLCASSEISQGKVVRLQDPPVQGSQRKHAGPDTQEEAMNIVRKLYTANIDCEQAIRVAKAYIDWEVANQTDG
jgi:hypothetical protein